MIYNEQIEIAKEHLAHVDHEIKRQARMHNEHARVTMRDSARRAASKLERDCLNCAAAVREQRFEDIRYNLNHSIIFSTAVARVARDMGIMTA